MDQRYLLNKESTEVFVRYCFGEKEKKEFKISKLKRLNDHLVEKINVPFSYEICMLDEVMNG